MKSSSHAPTAAFNHSGVWSLATQYLQAPSLPRRSAALPPSPHALVNYNRPGIRGVPVTASTAQPRAGGAAPPIAAGPTSRVSTYPRTSWRAVIHQEDGDVPAPGPQGTHSSAAAGAAVHADGSGGASVGNRTGGGGCEGEGGEGNGGAVEGEGEGAYGGSLSAAELRVKLSLAAGSGRLDLTDCRLRQVPPQVLELTELEELQLSGNRLTALPEGLSRLTSLRRLGLAGNALTALPPGIGALTGLEGLWLHGNLLDSLPQQLGRLGTLRALSLAGNRLEALPAGCLSGLTSLTELTLAGNHLSRLPPGELAPLSRLRKLALNGNRLVATVPGELGLGLGPHMTALVELMLQGNRLTEVDPAVFECPALAELSLADNRLHSLPASLAAATSLARLHLFGNCLTTLSARQLAALPSLSACWLEGNPLGGRVAADLLAVAGGGSMPRLKALGLDQRQAAAAAAYLATGRVVAAAQCPQSSGSSSGSSNSSSGSSNSSSFAATGHSSDGTQPQPQPQLPLPATVRVGCVLGSGPGYFKLQYGPQRAAEFHARGVGGGVGGQEDDAEEDGVRSSNDLLVVAFGSAPGTPNWGGLLSKVYRAAAEGERHFDVLYVADPTRDWYGGGDDAMYDYYRTRLSYYTRHYRRVLMLGDSMGATAALLFADLATAALAFCPQVDLTTASIRPGRPAAWLDRLRSRLMASVRASAGELVVLVGTWQHDLAQANMLPQQLQQQQRLGRALGAMTGEERGRGGQAGGAVAGLRWRSGASMEGHLWSAEPLTEGALPSGLGAVQAAVGSAVHRRPWAWQCSDEAAEGGEDGGVDQRSGRLSHSSKPSPGAGDARCEGSVSVRVFSVDSHRLAAALDARGQLVPLVRDMILQQLGLRSGNVRVSNLL